jgi:hypothetical protein
VSGSFSARSRLRTSNNHWSEQVVLAAGFLCSHATQKTASERNLTLLPEHSHTSREQCPPIILAVHVLQCQSNYDFPEIRQRKIEKISSLRNLFMTTAPQPKNEPIDHTTPSPPSATASGIRRAPTPAPISRPLTPVLAGFSFLDGVGTKRLGRDNLDTWVEQNLISPGYLTGPLRIHEPIFGALTTDKGCSPFLPESPPADETFALLVRARARIIGHLRGLLRTPSEDRFMTAAIFSRRVRRASIGEWTGWTPHPRNDDKLSDVITTLFVSDILKRREFYEQNLCICLHCGRVRFDTTVAIDRHKCFFC